MIISNQHEKVPMLWCSAVPAVTKLNTRLENIAKNKAPLWYVAQCSQSSLGKKKKKKKLESAMNYSVIFLVFGWN